ncbi:bifunctional 2-polyprenyl-6-hydroxyphenol methylase/3-demethylubiquinol 3-O-methyltransferase UbiG [Afifella sp. IM 167]|uniref:class I SAM-dependent methyltransferase n=1 Tax=Afifella sp. IM 167 TaxID=2033586 RepID=UPI001CCDE1B7|nr:class I SAM-dependent methyltransferase [Afifella sp. IM 167]MBZ8135361.1 hypothetical protein [Afifella sp. IM 167]
MDPYLDPRLASLYDLLNPPGEDTRFYLRLAGSEPCSILDLGCGTGTLARSLARRGHRVTAADPAAAMLEIAQEGAGAGRVTWIEGDALALAEAGPFDLVIMAGHAFQCLLDDAVIAANLAAVREKLAEGGRFAFESRNPRAEAWRRWTPGRSRRLLRPNGGVAVETYLSLVDVEDEIVTYRTHARFPGEEEVIAQSALRFSSREALEKKLGEAGFGDIAVYGDWDGAPFKTDSAEIIIVAR